LVNKIVGAVVPYPEPPLITLIQVIPPIVTVPVVVVPDEGALKVTEGAAA
jgi:hypothetical protein